VATLECRSAQRGIASRWVKVEGITDAQVITARAKLDRLLKVEEQISTAVALAFVAVATMCPDANPSDLWQHVIYRHLLKKGWNDNKWKRVSGFALERALVALYEPRLAAHGLRIRILDAGEANAFLSTLGTDVQSTKVDLFLEGEINDAWRIFGAVHVKSSIAERIQDDVPASRFFMENGLTSIMLTMDSKSYPPPHGDCINYGELGGRSLAIEKERLKRGYIENAGQFDGLFSFNLRTPPSPPKTLSDKRIYAMSFSEKQPDKLVQFIIERWATYLKGKVG